MPINEVSTNLFVKPDQLQIIRYVHNTERVGVAGAGLPAGDQNDRVACLDETAHLSELQTVLYTQIHIFDPVGVLRS